MKKYDEAKTYFQLAYTTQRKCQAKKTSCHIPHIKNELSFLNQELNKYQRNII